MSPEEGSGAADRPAAPLARSADYRRVGSPVVGSRNSGELSPSRNENMLSSMNRGTEDWSVSVPSTRLRFANGETISSG